MHTQALEKLLSLYDMEVSDSRVHFEKSDAMPLISKLAEEIPADLVVTGTVGRTGIPGFFIGNTAESLMHELRLPVLAVKPEKVVSAITMD
mgnify:CR=1 FL=1